jgi:hypothetical protein
MTYQARGYNETFDSGSHLQTLGKTTTSHVNLGIAEPEHGGLNVALMRNGSLLVLVPSYGFMGNVSVSHWCLFTELKPTSFPQRVRGRASFGTMIF